LKNEHNISFDLYEGFTAKERANIRKSLNELRAPSFVMTAFENGQYSLVSSFFKHKGLQVRGGRK
jgi:carbonic anhydrase